MRRIAAPGTHLFLQRVPADTESRWHTVKLDCGKHHHAETDKRKNRGNVLPFFFLKLDLQKNRMIMGIMSENER